MPAPTCTMMAMLAVSFAAGAPTRAAPACTAPASAAALAATVAHPLEISSGDFIIRGTLLLPKDRPPAAMVVLVAGTGDHDENGTIGRFQPFRQWAEHFASRGIATFRYRERPVHGPAANPQTTTLTLAQDLATIVRALRSQRRFAVGWLGALGHSEGAVIATLAARTPAPLDYVVAVGMPAGTGRESVMQQKRVEDAALRRTPVEVQRTNRTIVRLMDAVQDAPDARRAREALERFSPSLNRLGIPMAEVF